jgi:hypothetical protein
MELYCYELTKHYSILNYIKVILAYYVRVLFDFLKLYDHSCIQILGHTWKKVKKYYCVGVLSLITTGGNHGMALYVGTTG